MANQIGDLPTPADFGLSFNYALWTPNTVVTLCTVPWNSDYRDIVGFADHAALDAYLSGVSGPSVGISRLTMARATDPIRLNLPFNACYLFNYIRVSNGTSPITAHYTDENGIARTIVDTPKTLYYFVSDVTYLAPNTTQLSIELDVWQTFGFDVTFGNCYIDQGHIGVANENQFDHQGRDYLTILEGLDIGEEYNINATYTEVLETDFVPPEGSDPLTSTTRPWIVMGIAADVTSDPGTVDSPNLTLFPIGSSSESLPNGYDIIVFVDILHYQAFLGAYANYPWITQTIQFITLIPPINNIETSTMDRVNFFITPEMLTLEGFRFSGATLVDSSYAVILSNDFRADLSSNIPSRYTHLKKFLTYPYSLVELTTYNGSPLILRPELIPDDFLSVLIYQHMAPPAPRWAFVPAHYNAGESGGSYDDGEFLDFATYISNFPQFTVMNNGYMQYLAANSGSLAYQLTSANWSQQKALYGANIGLDNVNAGINASTAQNKANINANNQRLRIHNLGSVASGATSVLGDLAHFNPIGAITDVLGGGQQIATQSAMNAVANNLAQSSTDIGNEAAGSIGLNNLQLANFAAKGDYQNAIAARNAQIQNAKVAQPSYTGQSGGESFFVALTDSWKLYGKLKQINLGMMSVIGEYWLRYGYTINRFGHMPADYQVMTKFTYWKLKETYITSSRCPEMFKQTIRGIFEKGVTVWVNPDDIGNVDMSTNEPLSGISY